MVASGEFEGGMLASVRFEGGISSLGFKFQFMRKSRLRNKSSAHLDIYVPYHTASFLIASQKQISCGIRIHQELSVTTS